MNGQKVVNSIRDFVSDKTKKTFPLAHADNIYRLVVRGIFDEAINTGYYRLPEGYGAFKLKELKGGTKVVPATGEKIKVGTRNKVRYQQGVTIANALTASKSAAKSAKK